MIQNNTDRKNFKILSRNVIEEFTSIEIKRMFTFGDSGCIIWCSDNLHKNTYVITYLDRGYVHLISDYRIILSIRL